VVGNDHPPNPPHGRQTPHDDETQGEEGKGCEMNPPRFKIGTTFTLPNKRKGAGQWTVDDVLRTYNTANELVDVRYVCSKPYIGSHRLTDYRVCDTTIAMHLDLGQE